MDFASNDPGPVAVAVDLVNSLGSVSGRERLGSPDALRRFLDDHGLLTAAEVGDNDVAEVARVRARLREVFEAPTADDRARLLNGLLHEVAATPQLSDHDGDWHVHYVPRDTSPATVIAAAAAMGITGVIVRSGHQRLGICAADGCFDVFVDTSKNRSRRYCNGLCSARTNVAAYRARHAQRRPDDVRAGGGRPRA